MSDTREKLIELLSVPIYPHLDADPAEVVADYLIANGVRLETETSDKTSEWTSVDDEKKPKDRRNYFIAYVFGNSDIHFFGEAKYHAYEGNGVVDRPHFSNEGVEGMRVTHWMEIPKLPEPPEVEK